jgi:hypothetical protein
MGGIFLPLAQAPGLANVRKVPRKCPGQCLSSFKVALRSLNGMAGKKWFNCESFGDQLLQKNTSHSGQEGVYHHCPSRPEWRYVIDDATNIMQEIQQLGTAVDQFSNHSLDHRQGEFLAIPVEVSFGGGQMVRASLGLI